MKNFYYHKSDGFIWFRLFGYGLSIKNINKFQLTFSQRNGYRKYFLLFNKYCISPLNKKN